MNDIKLSTICRQFKHKLPDGKSRLLVEANELVTACNALMSSEAVARKRLKQEDCVQQDDQEMYE